MFKTGSDRIAALAAFAVSLVLALAAPAAAGPASRIEPGASATVVEVTRDSAVVLESVEPFSELVIANPSIADISTISGTTLYVLGKQPGRTTLMLIREDSSVMSVIDVRVSPDVTELSRRLSEVLPGEAIEVMSANDGLVLAGTVSGPEVVRRALELAGHYASGKVSNLLTVAAVAPAPAPEPVAAPQEVVVEASAPPLDPVAVEARIREILPDEAISAHALGGTLVLSGKVSSQERVQQAVQIARLVANGAEISNLLTVEEARTCTVRTRRGGEMIETVIPCSA